LRKPIRFLNDLIAIKQALNLTMLKQIALITLLGSYLAASQAQTSNAMIISPLPGQWEFKAAEEEGWLPATVPGTVHTDLLANGLIEDPFYRLNEKQLQWIDKKNWIYRCYFQLDSALLNKERISLEFQGLDTYADVYLNGRPILLADNFFRRWETDIKPHLRADSNELYLLFHSPTQIGLEKLGAHGYGLPAINDQSENGEMGDKKVSVFVRKPGYHFGWDWGPRLVTSGIWRPILVKAWDEARLTDAYFYQQSISAEQAQLEAQLEIEAERPIAASLTVYWGDSLLARQEVALQAGRQKFSLALALDEPQLWWTKELGEPFLYHLSAVLESGGQPISTIEHRIGLRSIRLVQEPDGQGTSFYFELNGKPVFSKGANYIPNDIFLNRVDADWYREIIHSAADANMNMLRVWGGGIYEDKLFYDLCDELGILVWQDFMFACSMYPGDATFIESVKQEAIDNIKRLRNHACIALWCGNNEIDIAWANYKETSGWGWKQRYTMAQRATIWANYERVFHQLLPDMVAAHHPGAFYWPSSPYASPGTHATNNSTSGDTHYWGVWHAEHPFRDFRNNVSRFVSEYGFQSFPEFRSVQQYTLPEDHDIKSEVMASHQRSGIGNLRIRSYMKDWYKLPPRFDHFLYVGQLLQAEAIKMAIEAHLSAKPYCMGTLYWQLNDCWPVASWSGIDYYRRWKAMHYFVKKAFQPETIVFIDQKDKLDLYVCSGRGEDAQALLSLDLLDFNGKTLWLYAQDIRLSADSSLLAVRFPLGQFSAFGDKSNTLLRARLYQDGAVLHENLYYFTEPKNLKLPPQPAIRATVEAEEDGSYSILLNADALAKNVFLEFAGVAGRFSDNYFDLLPGHDTRVRFTPQEALPQPLSAKGLSIVHLKMTY
jgi:beta-mannosidase